MEWAIEESLKTGLAVGATMCIASDGDMHGVTIQECAQRMARAGNYYFPLAPRWPYLHIY